MDHRMPGFPVHHSNSSPLSRWYHPTISSSVITFSSCLRSFPASGFFPASQFFASGDPSVGVSASTSVLPMNTQDWFPLGWTGWISLQSKRLSRVFSNTTIQKHQLFGAQLYLYSNFHIHTWLLEKTDIRPSRTNTPKRCLFHYRRLELKSRKSRNTWINGKIWPWSTEWSKAKANRVLPRELTGHSKHPLPTTQVKTLLVDITRWSILKSDWLYSLQLKMDKLYTVSKNKTRSWLWLRSWAPYCQIQA